MISIDIKESKVSPHYCFQILGKLYFSIGYSFGSRTQEGWGVILVPTNSICLTSQFFVARQTVFVLNFKSPF